MDVCMKVATIASLLLMLPCGHVIDAAIPTFNNVDPVVKLYELTTSITTITDTDCTDPDGGTTIVSLTSVSPSGAPCSNCFQVYPSCGGGLSGSYCLQFLPLGSLDYDKVNTYTITLDCVDDNSPPETATMTVELRLEPNTPPYFASLGSVTATLSNTESVTTGGSVYAVACTDPNSDTLTYPTFNTIPSSSLFTIDSSGVIRATGDLRAECRNSITFEVTCQDPYNPPVGPIYIQTTLNGANQQPSITGLNYIKDVPEDTAIGGTLATFTVTDDDSPSCLLSASPLESLQYFELDISQRSILVKTTLDYEQFQTRNTNLTVTCSDGFCTSPATFLYVRVTDVNEPITLYPQDFTLSTYEGSISLDPKWTPIDEDLNDDPTYTIVGGNTNGRFAIDPVSGFITSTLPYDVDQNAMPVTDLVVVQVMDEAGHTSTTTVTLSILDANDNRPSFTTNALSFTITDCLTTIGTTLGTLMATDLDSSFQGNNVLTYSGANGPITIGSTGEIIAGSSISAGSTYVVQATATDSGQYPQALSSVPPASVTVVVTACPTTTTLAPTTTTAAPTISAASTTTRVPVVTTQANAKQNLDENLGWIVIAALLATVFLAALGFMLWRFVYPITSTGRYAAVCRNACGDCCMPREPIRTVKPMRGQPPRNGNKGFWQERYPDDDYRDQPIRDRTPSPAPYEGGAPLALEPTTSWRPRAIQY